MITSQLATFRREKPLLLTALLISLVVVTIYALGNGSGTDVSRLPSRTQQQAVEEKVPSKDQSAVEETALNAVDEKFIAGLASLRFCEPLKQGAAPVADDEKVAVLVEHRDSAELTAVLSHFMGALPEWKFHVFHSDDNFERLNGAAWIRRALQAGTIKLTRIPDEFPVSSHPEVSRFLTDTWLWNQLQEEHVLMFRVDSMICSNSDLEIDNYLHYDFVGGPALSHGQLVYNGGFSLRRRSKLLAALAQHDLRNQTWINDREDQWFSRVLAELPDSCMPSPLAAAEFSVDMLWYKNSLGGHQIWRWHPPERLAEFEARCPELRMIQTRKHAYNSSSHHDWNGEL